MIRKTWTQVKEKIIFWVVWVKLFKNFVVGLTRNQSGGRGKGKLKHCDQFQVRNLSNFKLVSIIIPHNRVCLDRRPKIYEGIAIDRRQRPQMWLQLILRIGEKLEIRRTCCHVDQRNLWLQAKIHTHFLREKTNPILTQVTNRAFLLGLTFNSNLRSVFNIQPKIRSQ